MELRVLNYFLMVAREENITKAAGRLHVTQPTLSRQLRQLEDELGVKLFERSSHNVTLTADGMLLKRRAQEIVMLAEKTRQDFMNEEKNLGGTISIGCGELQGMNIVAEIISDFHRSHPEVKFDIYSGNADSIKEKIENGTLDMGLLIEPVDIGKYDFIRVSVEEEWGVIVRSDSPFAAKGYVMPEDLEDEPLIVSKRDLVQNELSSWFGEYADSMSIIATYNLMYNAELMVKQGVGTLIGIRLESRFDNLVFVPFAPELRSGSVLAWKKGQMFSAAITRFLSDSNKYLHDKVYETQE